jgi:colanic acid biosynthesis glycosyl transferase WcaI
MNSMRILIVTSYYWPEGFRVTDLAAGLKARGHDVAVLTGLPNYPAGRFFDGYGIRGPFREEHQGIPIIRVPIVPRGDGRAANLVLNYASFAASAALRALTIGGRAWDVVFVFQLSPVTTLFPACAIRAVFGVPVVAWVQDLWPESIASAGFARSPRMFSAARAISGWLYRRCDRILGTSRAFQPRLESLGVPAERFGYLPQWAEDLFRDDTGAPATADAPWADGFPVMFAGNLGRVQALDTLLDAAERLKGDPEIRWVFLGDGSRREWLTIEAERRGLGGRVFVLGRQPVGQMPAFYAKAGAMLVSLKPDDTMALTVPAKVQSYLAAGRPIIGSISGEAAQVIEESGAGWAAPAGDPVGLAEIVTRMKSLPEPERIQMGQRGRDFSLRNFARERCLDTLERTLAEAAEARRR